MTGCRRSRLLLIFVTTFLALCVRSQVTSAEEAWPPANVGAPFWLYFVGSSEREWSLPEPLGDPQDLASRANDAFTVKSSYVDREAKGDLRVFWSFHAKSSRDDLELMGEGDLGPAPFGVDSSQRLLRLGLFGTWEKFDYGAEFRRIPKGFEKLSAGPLGGSKSLGGSTIEGDQQGLEMWAKRDLGPLRLKTCLSRFSNNVDDDPSRGVTTKTSGRVGLDARLPMGPILSVSYEGGLSEAAVDARNSVTHQNAAETVGASLYYWIGPEWDITLTANSSSSRDRRYEETDTLARYYSLSTSYRPAAAVTLTPTVALTEERYEGSRTKRETPSVSLSLTYTPLSDDVNVSTWASYSKTKTTDGQVDVDAVELTGSLAWTMARWGRGRQVLSIDVSHGQSRDAIYRNASYSYSSAFLRFRAVSF